MVSALLHTTSPTAFVSQPIFQDVNGLAVKFFIQKDLSQEVQAELCETITARFFRNLFLTHSFTDMIDYSPLGVVLRSRYRDKDIS